MVSQWGLSLGLGGVSFVGYFSPLDVFCYWKSAGRRSCFPLGHVLFSLIQKHSLGWFNLEIFQRLSLSLSIVNTWVSFHYRWGVVFCLRKDHAYALLSMLQLDLFYFLFSFIQYMQNIGDLYFGWWHLHITLEQKSKVLEVLIWISQVESRECDSCWLRASNNIAMNFEIFFICFTLIVI